MRTNCTQGTWTVNKNNQVEARNQMGTLMARFYQFTPKDMRDNANANAKLIASAPNMLKELENAESTLDCLLGTFVPRNSEVGKEIKKQLKRILSIIKEATE